MSELYRIGLRESRDLLRAGDIRAEDLTAACLARMDATEERLGALLARRDARRWKRQGRWMPRARQAACPPWRKPLCGVCLSVSRMP